MSRSAQDAATALEPVPGDERGEDEAALVRAAGAGQAAAFSTLYDRYCRVVARRLSHLLGPAFAVDDLVQDTFLRVMQGLPGFRGESPFRHWLLRIATSVARDEQRRTKRSIWRLFLDPDTIDEAPAAASSTEAYADLLLVHRALQKLSPRLREVVVLFELEGQTLAAIAAELDISIHTAGSRLRRGREKLRHVLERAGYGALAGSPTVLCTAERP